LKGPTSALSREQVEALAKRFGGCGCKDRCEMEQYGEAGADRKPRGRFSVCEVEAEQRDVKIPRKP
jgi:hypothetical protein